MPLPESGEPPPRGFAALWRRLQAALAHSKRVFAHSEDVSYEPDRPFTGTEMGRRLIHGAPHRYRKGDDLDRRKIMGAFLSAQYITGGIAGLVALSNDRANSSKWLIVPSLTGIIGGSAILWFRQTISAAAYHALLLSGGCAIYLAIRSGGALGPALGAMFLIGAGYSFVFFFHWRALVYFTFALIVYYEALNHNHFNTALTHALIMLVTGTSLGFSVSAVVGREAKFRDSEERLKSNAKTAADNQLDELGFLFKGATEMIGSAQRALREAVERTVAPGGEPDEGIQEAAKKLADERDRFELVWRAYSKRGSRLEGATQNTTLHHVLEQAIAKAKSMYPNVTFQTDISGPKVDLPLSSVVLSLTEVISNAAEHASGAPVGVRAQVGTNGSQDVAIFVVDDFGGGVEQPEVGSLVTSNPGSTAQHERWGVGFKLAEWLLAPISGTLTINPKTSGASGTTVTITVPIRTKVEQATRFRVLIVEDDDMTLKLVKEYVRKWPGPVEINTQISIRGAREYLSSSGYPHVAILDLALPDGDGVLLAREIRALEDKSVQPCVIVAYTSRPPGTYAELFDHYLRKPASEIVFAEVGKSAVG